jgi:hypothetical protein
VLTPQAAGGARNPAPVCAAAQKAEPGVGAGSEPDAHRHPQLFPEGRLARLSTSSNHCCLRRRDVVGPWRWHGDPLQSLGFCPAVPALGGHCLEHLKRVQEQSLVSASVDAEIVRPSPAACWASAEFPTEFFFDTIQQQPLP